MKHRFSLQADDGDSSSDVSPRRVSPAAVDRAPSAPASRSTSAGPGKPASSSKHAHDLELLRRGLSVDTAVNYDYMPRTSFRDRNNVLNGLPRIRHAPPDGPLKRVQTLPNLNMALAQNQNTSEPKSTPTLATRGSTLSPVTASMTSDVSDLHRFPTVSLHSFSFAAPADELLHARRATLKRSVDVMRARLGFDSNALAEPDMMETTQDSHLHGLFGDRNIIRKPMVGGPVTGPPTVDTDNIFEKAFVQADMLHHARHPTGVIDPSDYSPILSPIPDDDAPPQPTGEARTSSFASRRNSSSYQQQKRGRLLTNASSVSELSSYVQNMGTDTPLTPVLHTHSSKWAPISQAVFTTSSKPGWTIHASNDVACLVFGVTQKELRELSILDLVQEERRDWVKAQLMHARQQERQSEAEAENQKSKTSPTTSENSTSPMSHAMGNGVTAKLLSKPSSRQTRTSPKQQQQQSAENSEAHRQSRSRGVLLCGDVIPIRRRNGATGSASVWVMEKRAGLIWVLEEVAEDTIRVRLGDGGRIVESQGKPDPIWGWRSIKADAQLSDLLPQLPPDLPRQCDDLVSKVAGLKYYTALTRDGYSVPVTVSETTVPHALRISHFPHAAGMMVISATTLKVLGANSVFSGTLLGHESPEGLTITKLIPNFDEYLDIMNEEDDLQLSDGMFIPEQGFRRARAVLSIRHGKDDAVTLFEKPVGIPARHRDGADIMVDVSMRVMKSGTVFSKKEDGLNSCDGDGQPILVKEAMYALWINYHRPPSLPAYAGVPRARPLSPSQTDSGQASPRTTVGAARDGGEQTLMQQQLKEAASADLDNDTRRGYVSTEASLTELTRESARAKSINDYTIVEDMGQGAYGQVKLARLKTNPAKRVVLKYVTKKRILVDTWTRDRRLGTVPLEIHVLDYLRRENLRHPNIVEMEGFFEDDVNYYIEMLPHGLPGMDLFDYIELRTNMSESECRSIFSQVVDAIHHLHTRALVVHRDIKDENVILDGEARIKLIDFGSAAYVKNGPFDVFVGTIDYAAPEVLQGKSYNGKEQDIWALGILLYTIIYKENPFYDVDEILDHPLRVPFLPFSESCIDIIRGMLNRNVEERLSIEEVMSHPWMKAEEDANGAAAFNKPAA